MKINSTFLILFLVILSCRNQQEEIIVKEQIKSRIKNDDLKKIIPHLLEIHKQTFEDNPYYENNFHDPVFVRFITSENYVYAHLSWMDCTHTSLYSFVEELDSMKVQIFVERNSYQPERYFNLSSLNAISEKKSQICEDWYFIACKFKNYNGKLILEKVSTFFDNSYENNFFDKSDSIFLNEIGILIPEPELEPAKLK